MQEAGNRLQMMRTLLLLFQMEPMTMGKIILNHGILEAAVNHLYLKDLFALTRMKTGIKVIYATVARATLRDVIGVPV